MYGLLKLFLIIFIFSSNHQLNNNEKIYSLKMKIEIKNLKYFFKVCNNGRLLNKKKFIKSLKPKISIISTIYNGEKFVLRFIRSIQNQFFDDIEIIIIDDFSSDETVKIVKKYQKEDERIILLKNKKNKGTLISRNIGVIKSKGEFIIIPDVDDIFSKNIIRLCYELAKKYNCEMIRFNVYQGPRGDYLIKMVKFLKSRLIFQPEISTFLFYGMGYLHLNDFSIWNKFIKREAFIRTLNNIKKFYLYQKMTIYEDALINYILHRNINSFFLIKKIGYYYTFNKKKISNLKNIMKNKLKNFFLYLKFVFENSKNNIYEKNMPFYIFKKYRKNFKYINLINKDFKFYIDVIDMFLNNKFIFKNYTIILKKLKNIFISKRISKKII